MTWPDSIQEIIDEFQEIEDQFERLEVLMDFADEVDELPVDEWSDGLLILKRYQRPCCKCHT